MITFAIPEQPQGKARARVTKWGTYTPEKTLNYEALVKQIYVYEAKGTLHDGAIRMDIVAKYDIPKSYTKGKRLAAEHNVIRPTKKPDFDNVAKIISDALNKIAYNDDSQIVEATFRKVFSNVPCVEVTISEVKCNE